MADLHITTTRGSDTVFDEATVQGFKTSLRGVLRCRRRRRLRHGACTPQCHD